MKKMILGAVLIAVSMFIPGCNQQPYPQQYVAQPVSVQPAYVQQDNGGSLLAGMAVGSMLSGGGNRTTIVHTTPRSYYRPSYRSTYSSSPYRSSYRSAFRSRR